MKKILIIIFMLATTFCFAGEYTLNHLIEIGFESTYAIKEAQNSIWNSQSSYRSSIIGILPQLTVNAGSSKNFDYDADWDKSASLSLSKNISLNEPSYYNVRTSIIDLENARITLKEQKKIIAYTIFQKYISILETQQNLEVIKRNLELQKQIKQQVQILYESGDKSSLELKQAEIDLIDYQISVNEAENSISSLRKDLFSYLNIEDEGYTFSKLNFQFDHNQSTFKENNNILLKRNYLKKDKLLLFQKKMNFLPSISLGFSLIHNDDNDVLGISDYYRISNTISLSASYNIFDLLETRESYLRSKRNYKLSEFELENSLYEDEIELQNRQDELNVLNITKELNQQKLELASENLEMAQQQYKHGLISYLDLENYKIAYQNAEISNNSNFYDILLKQEEINLLLSNKILGKW